MNGECGQCGRHTLECECQEFMNTPMGKIDLPLPSIDFEFIERAEKLMKPLWDEFREIRRQKIDKWNNENREKVRELNRTYSKTEKGKYACSKRNHTRRSKFNEASQEISWEEKELIGQFYKNCPNGYEVDHIHPISRGGKHALSNL